MRALRPLVLLSWSAFVSSCLLAEPPGAHMSPPVAVDDFCTRFAQAVCDGFDHCCEDPAARMAAPTHAMCVDAVIHSCTQANFGSVSLSELVHDPRTGYDPIVAGAVLGIYNDYIDRCDPSVVAWSNRRDGFISALQGTLDVNARCLNGSALDNANFGSFLSCDPEHACILTNISEGYCNGLRPTGGSCTLDFDCQAGLYCTGGLNATCQPRLANGSACGAADGSPHHNWCESSYCYMGHCDTPTQDHVYCGGDYSPRP